jgi:hypothetical protein
MFPKESIAISSGVENCPSPDPEEPNSESKETARLNEPDSVVVEP